MVVSQISEHLEKFWSPAMKDLIIEQEDNNVGLTPISQKAVIQLAAMRRAK